MMTNRELKDLLNSLPEDELDKQVCMHSGHFDSLVNFNAEILNDEEFKRLCRDLMYDPDEDGISRLVLYAEG